MAFVPLKLEKLHALLEKLYMCFPSSQLPSQLVLLHVSLSYLFLHRYLKISSLIHKYLIHFSGLLHVNPFKYAYDSCWQVNDITLMLLPLTIATLKSDI